MNMSYLFLILALSGLLSCAHEVVIHDLGMKKVISRKEFISQLPDKGFIVIGENHYNKLVQEEEGRLIHDTVISKNQVGQFTTGWEFLNFPDQEVLNENFNAWKKDEINEAEFLKKQFGKSSTMHASYLPVLKTVKELDGQLIALNAPREWKKEIMRTGLDKADKKYLPLKIQKGSKGYEERFNNVMKDHVKGETPLGRFFEAQYYTDSVMAWSALTYSEYQLRFLIAGAFHADYKDALVSELRRQASGQIVSIKMLDAREMSEKEIAELLSPHDQYGDVADYVYLIR